MRICIRTSDSVLNIIVVCIGIASQCSIISSAYDTRIRPSKMRLHDDA